MGQTIGEKLNYGRATAEAQEWAQVEGKHAEMHLLRDAAIFGAHTLMEHLGVEEVKEQDSGSVRGVEVIRASQTALTGGGYVRIEESKRSYTIPPQEPQGFRVRLSRRVAGKALSAEDERSKLQFAIIKKADDGAENETVMMSHPQLDVRPNLLWKPKGMMEHYQSQINQLAIFMGEIDDLALNAGAYIYSRHIGEYLEDRSAQ